MDPSLMDVHPEVLHAPYDDGSYNKRRNLHRHGRMVGEGSGASALRRVFSKPHLQDDPKKK